MAISLSSSAQFSSEHEAVGATNRVKILKRIAHSSRKIVASHCQQVIAAIIRLSAKQLSPAGYRVGHQEDGVGNRPQECTGRRRRGCWARPTAARGTRARRAPWRSGPPARRGGAASRGPRTPRPCTRRPWAPPHPPPPAPPPLRRPVPLRRWWPRGRRRRSPRSPTTPWARGIGRPRALAGLGCAIREASRPRRWRLARGLHLLDVRPLWLVILVLFLFSALGRTDDSWIWTSLRQFLSQILPLLQLFSSK